MFHTILDIFPIRLKKSSFLNLSKQSALKPRLLKQKFWTEAMNPRSKNGLLPPIGERLALSEVEGSQTAAPLLPITALVIPPFLGRLI